MAYAKTYAKTTTPGWCIRVSQAGRESIRLIAAYTNETVGQLIERLALAELARVEQRRAEATVGERE